MRLSAMQVAAAPSYFIYVEQLEHGRDNHIHHIHTPTYTQMGHHFRNIVRKSSGVTKIK